MVIRPMVALVMRTELRPRGMTKCAVSRDETHSLMSQFTCLYTAMAHTLLCVFDAMCGRVYACGVRADSHCNSARARLSICISLKLLARSKQSPSLTYRARV